jgi:uncharacterized SAM-binding protein YcdF (DUF218 family)
MLKRILKWFFISFGSLTLILLLLCFTSAPFWRWYNLGTKKAGVHRPPDFIVVLGGGGMPSESGLMRTWYAAKAANYFTRSKVIVALPGDTSDSLSSVRLMVKELVIRGIEPGRIMIEDSGTNTRAEALQIQKLSTKDKGQSTKELSIVNCQLSILIITSPEHLYRSVLAFKKAGFMKVDGIPAFERTIETDLSFTDNRLGGRKWLPGIGENIAIRYRFWTQLHYEELVIREYLAIAYYWMKGWI